jgi:hypothetical protein
MREISKKREQEECFRFRSAESYRRTGEESAMLTYIIMRGRKL